MRHRNFIAVSLPAKWFFESTSKRHLGRFMRVCRLTVVTNTATDTQTPLRLLNPIILRYHFGNFVH